MSYIKPPRVIEKLKKAEELYLPVIMMAANGFGKTAAVNYFYKRKNPLVLHAKDGGLDEMPPEGKIRSGVVVIEDMQWLSDEKSILYLKGLLKAGGRQIVMLTRGSVPKYLAGEDMDLGFVRIHEEDFAFGEKEIRDYFADRGAELSSEDLRNVLIYSKGYPRAVYFYFVRMENKEGFSDEIRSAVDRDIFRLWDGSVYEQWPAEYTAFALSMCAFDDFTVEMAEYVTGNRSIGRIIEYCTETMSQLRYGNGEHLSLRPEMRAFFKWKQNLIRTKEEIQENYRRGADYYEMKGDFPNALKYYKLAGATQRVKELLVRNAHSHPGSGHYFDTREYYLELPEEEIREMPVLMAGMSMLYAIMLQPENAEKWYADLVSYEKNSSNPREKIREARVWLAYLDISLPCRGTKGILRIMRNVFTLIGKGDVKLPEFCVTGNLPSVMNGGLDFCEWSKNDTQIAKFMKKPIEAITGRHSNGLVTIALAESGFEKGTMSAYEVLTRLGDGYEEAAHGGKIEMCFVSVGIQVRQHLIEGQLPSARRIYEYFREKVIAEKAGNLLPNLDAFGVWISLFAGNSEPGRKFIDEVPDAKVTFCIMDRYRQMVKLRCLIAAGRLEEALDLCNFLMGYFASYDRFFYRMENELLKGVILHGLGDEHWKDCIVFALEKAAEYHFVRLVALEGTAVMPLITELNEEGLLSDIPEEFLTQIISEGMRMTIFFPDYLKYTPMKTVNLTARESQVLAMLCSGKTTDEICAELGISYGGLKKHNRSIYKKLDAKDRAEAERNAIRLGLVHRG